MKVVVFGLGYVGFTAACCIASQGHEVYGIDVSEEKVRGIGRGTPPFAEPGLKELLGTALQNDLLRVGCEIGGSLAGADLVIVCVGTPSAADGSHNMSYVAEVARQIATAVSVNREQPLTVSFRSTFRPGTMERLIIPIFQSSLGERFGDIVELVYNPEFLRESQAVSDYFSPPKIVVGTSDGKPSAAVDALHDGIESPVFHTRYGEAEFTKFVDNSWHAVKVAYANEIGRVCSRMGISAKKVHEIFVSDTKLNISPYYTRPGGAFGGSCLPKDVRALQHIATDVGANTHLVDSLIRSNEAHKNFQFDSVVSGLDERSEVLMVGLAFKAETDDLRESPNVDLARKMIEAGIRLSVYDQSLEPAKLKGQNLGYAYSHLPTIDSLLVDVDTVRSRVWDRVIASNRSIEALDVRAKDVVVTHTIA